MPAIRWRCLKMFKWQYAESSPGLTPALRHPHKWEWGQHLLQFVIIIIITIITITIIIVIIIITTIFIIIVIIIIIITIINVLDYFESAKSIWGWDDDLI